MVQVKMGLRNLEFRNPVSKINISKILSEADVFFVSLERAAIYRYGISLNKIFDYMAAGKPVIFSGQSSNNPIEESSCGLTVPPRDAQALAEAIIKIYYMSQEERDTMGGHGREYVEKYHNIVVLAEKFDQCIKTIL